MDLFWGSALRINKITNSSSEWNTFPGVVTYLYMPSTAIPVGCWESAWSFARTVFDCRMWISFAVKCVQTLSGILQWLISSVPRIHWNSEKLPIYWSSNPAFPGTPCYTQWAIAFSHWFRWISNRNISLFFPSSLAFRTSFLISSRLNIRRLWCVYGVWQTVSSPRRM